MNQIYLKQKTKFDSKFDLNSTNNKCYVYKIHPDRLRLLSYLSLICIDKPRINKFQLHL